MPDTEPFEFPWESMMPEELKPNFPITTTLGDIVSKILPFVFRGAAFALLIYLILGAFQFLTSGGDPKAVEAARSRITNAIIGFVVIFASILLIKLLENILGLPTAIE